MAERFRTIFQEQTGTFLNIYRRVDQTQTGSWTARQPSKMEMQFNEIPRLVQHHILTCGWVDAGSDVEVTKSVSVGNFVATFPVTVMSVLMVRQAPAQRGLEHIPVNGGLQCFLEVALQGKYLLFKNA